jgi:hypothetical protein
VQRGVQLLVQRQRVGHHDGPGRQGTPGGEDGRGLRRIGHRPVQRRAGVGDVEPGEGRRPVPDDGDRQGLQPLQRRRDVEDRLDPGADDDERGARQGGQVGGLVEGVHRLPVHPTQYPRREDADAGGGGQQGGAGDRRRAAEAQRGRHGEVADTQLRQVGVGTHPVDLGRGQPDVRNAVQHRDRGRNRTAGTDSGLDVVGRGAVVRPGQAVGEQRALQGDDGAARRQRVGDLGGQDGPAGCRLHPVIIEGGPDPPIRRRPP